MIIIGFMGSGKSTISKELADRLNTNVLELDDSIVEIAGGSIPEIFAGEGEAGFRQYEFKALSEMTEADGIISTGGGVVTFDDSFELIRRSDRKVIFLNADFEDLYARISGDDARPLAGRPKEEVLALYNSRLERYRKAADIEVDTSADLETALETIIKFMNE